MVFISTMLILSLKEKISACHIFTSLANYAVAGIVLTLALFLFPRGNGCLNLRHLSRLLHSECFIKCTALSLSNKILTASDLS